MIGKFEVYLERDEFFLLNGRDLMLLKFIELARKNIESYFNNF